MDIICPIITFSWTVVMGVTLAPAIFKPEKNLFFFQDKIAGARDATLVSLSE